jgi:hypothetical protein
VKYMINVDLEIRNSDGGATNCSSRSHEHFGPHYDLTVHTMSCGRRNSRAADRPHRRYWDRNNGDGYTLLEAVNRVQELQRQHPGAYPRRCGICGVDPQLPYWD